MKKLSERLKILLTLQERTSISGPEGFLCSKIACKILKNKELNDHEADYIVELMMSL